MNIAGAPPQTLATALVADNVGAATLAFRVTDAAGSLTRSRSAVSVNP